MSAILNSAYWIQSFWTKKFNSFILTQLDNVSHLEFCHLGFNNFAQNSDSNKFILTQLDDDSHLEFSHLGFSYFAQKHFTHSFWLNLMMAAILNSTSWIQPFCTKKIHSFILTQLDGGSHLEFCHVGFSHCHLGLRHLVIFSQIHSETLSLHSDSDSN